MRTLIVWEPEAAGEVELWHEIARYSIRGAPGSRMSQSGRTEGLDSPVVSGLLLCTFMRHAHS